MPLFYTAAEIGQALFAERSIVQKGVIAIAQGKCKSSQQDFTDGRVILEEPAFAQVIGGTNQDLRLGFQAACGLCLRQGVESKLLEHRIA